MSCSPEVHLQLYMQELQKILSAQNDRMSAREKHEWLLDGGVLAAYYKNEAIRAVCITHKNGDITLSVKHGV